MPRSPLLSPCRLVLATALACLSATACGESSGADADTWNPAADGDAAASGDKQAVACAKLAACMPSVSMSGCMDAAAVAGAVLATAKVQGGVQSVQTLAQEHPDPAVVHCLSTATSCDAVTKCLSGQLGPCQDGEVRGCKGTVGWVCLDGTRWNFECAKLGWSCTDAWGSDAVCYDPTPQPCQAGSNYVECTGDDAGVCKVDAAGISLGFRMHCGDLDMDCTPFYQSDSPILQPCTAPEGDFCVADKYPPHCNGTVAAMCKGGKELRVDCALAGLKCALDSGHAELHPCKQSGPGCDTGSHCTGTVLTYCADGYEKTLDCGVHGMTCGPAVQDSSCLFD